MPAPDLAPLLLESANYRDFLKKAFACLRKENPRFNYAAFARKAGFSSRSFPKDVESGYRRMTITALPKFAQGLGLRGEPKAYFELLVAVDEPDVYTGKLDRLEIRKKLQKIKQNLRSRIDAEKQANIPELFRIKYWQELYAALGSEERGASLSEIIDRTRISEAICTQSLEKLCQYQLATFNEQTQRYYSKNLHISFGKLGKDDFFKQSYLDLGASLLRDARDGFHRDDRLFFDSAFSVHTQDLPHLKKELRELLLRFVLNSEKSEGDRIAKIVVGLSSND
jgi:uncharacterized protein (TIGR02147 family)